MPLDPAALGESSAPRIVSWDADTCSLYALGVGAGVDDLAFVTENSRGLPQRTLPTMPVVLGMDVSVLKKAGHLDWTHVVHGSQRVRLDRELPTNGSAETTTRIAEMWDKGSAAIIVLETVATLVEGGVPLFRTRTGLYVRGAGGWGGERGSSRSRNHPPRRRPDRTQTYVTRREQALIYRLSGDHNPLHSDPEFATKAGFERPILHGLCTFGFAGRAVLQVAAGGDPRRVRAIEARFARPVLPGDALHVDIWRLDEASIAFRTRSEDGTIVLDDGHATIDQG